MTGIPQRWEVSESWRRSEMAGVQPKRAVPERAFGDAAGEGVFQRAAAPVVDDLLSQFGDLRFGVMSADSSARLTFIRSGHRRLQARFDRVGGVPGLSLAEEHCGTNTVGTVLETRAPIALHGDEHFLECFKIFSGVGEPVIHPVTRRIEGIVSISCEQENNSPLLRPLLALAAREIEGRLVEMGRAVHGRLLAEYRIARRDHPDSQVLAIGPDIVLESPGLTALGAGDRALVTSLANGLGRRERANTEVRLDAGRRVLTITRSAADPDSVICVLDPPRAGTRSTRTPWDVDERIPLRRSPAPDPVALKSARRRFAVTGSPGTGRTTAVRELGARASRRVVFEASRWAPASESQFRVCLQAHEHDSVLVVIEDAHLLPEATARRLAQDLAGTDTWVAVTSLPADGLGPEGRRLLSRFPEHVELQDLRHLAPRIPDLLRGLLRARGCGRPLSAGLQAVLAERAWPGNLDELCRLADDLARLPGRLPLTADALPESHRRATGRQLLPLERAEADTIRAALAQFQGNKSKTAEYLGISRTTLYQALRRYAIRPEPPARPDGTDAQ